MPSNAYIEKIIYYTMVKWRVPFKITKRII